MQKTGGKGTSLLMLAKSMPIKVSHTIQNNKYYVNNYFYSKLYFYGIICIWLCQAIIKARNAKSGNRNHMAWYV